MLQKGWWGKNIEGTLGDKIVDRIDIQCEIEPAAFDDMANKAPAESSAAIRERVIKARAIQTAIGYRALDRASYGQIF